MKCKFSRLRGTNVRYLWLTALLGTSHLTACGDPVPRQSVEAVKPAAPPSLPALPTARIAIVGASVSAGFGGAPFGELFAAAAKHSKVESYANVFLFRDPVGDTREQIGKAIAFHADSIFAIDLLFWDIYGSTDDRWRDRALASGLAELDRARAAGAWIVVGDVPHITTAAEILIAKNHVPDAETIARYNRQISDWARRDRVVIVPFAAWAEPLTSGGDVEIAPGERMPAHDLVAPDGLHANRLGAWAILDRLDRYLERMLPGTARDALVFVRPPPDTP